MNRVVQFWSKFIDKIESDITLELEEIIFSKKHGHEICVMHLVGKNAFPKMTAEEILANPKARMGLNKDDLIEITQLAMKIKQRKNAWRVVEIDRNGLVLLENNVGAKKKCSIHEISSNQPLQDNLVGSHVYGIGYRVGFKDGFKDGINVRQQKQHWLSKFLMLFKKIFIKSHPV
jgi:hypothetical protein